jgi:hypothetical protein
MTIDQFSAALVAAFGADCTAVVLYGSAARGDATKGSDFNVLVILRSLRGEALRAAAGPVRAWKDAGHRAPLILTEAEWRSSRDVFAMEHADIAARHRVLHGTLPALPAPSADDLRRQLEYEAMAALLQLRRGVLVVGDDPLAALDLLVASKGSALALLRSLLRVHGHAASEDVSAVLAAAGATAGIDTAPLAEVVAHARGERSIPPARAAEVLDGVHRLLKGLVAHVDAMWHPDAPAID